MLLSRPRRLRAATLAAVVALSSPLAGLALAQAGDRGLLWRVVQVCVANTRLTGASFPCLDVNLANGVESGFAVIRAPLENSHIIVTPTVRTTGVESVDLQAPGAPNYFQDAWRARHFVEERFSHAVSRDSIGMAVNSRLGRSQDQLHIHVDCLQAGVRDALRQHAADIHADHWSRLPFDLQGERYWALRLDNPDLADVNIFKLVDEGLHVPGEDRQRVTIVVAGASFERGVNGFYILAALAGHGRRNQGHGEFLMDHACAGA